MWANKLNRPDLVHNYEDKIKCGPMWEDAVSQTDRFHIIRVDVISQF